MPMGARFSAPVQTGPGAHPASCTMGTGSFPGVKSGWGVTLTPHPLLVSWSRKSRAIPLLPLWAVRPVQNLSACTRVHFAFIIILPICFKERVFISKEICTECLKKCNEIVRTTSFNEYVYNNKSKIEENINNISVKK